MRLGGELLGALVGRRLRAEVDALDVLRDVGAERGPAERVLDGDLDGFVRAWLEASAKAGR